MLRRWVITSLRGSCLTSRRNTRQGTNIVVLQQSCRHSIVGYRPAYQRVLSVHRDADELASFPGAGAGETLTDERSGIPATADTTDLPLDGRSLRLLLRAICRKYTIQFTSILLITSNMMITEYWNTTVSHGHQAVYRILRQLSGSKFTTRLPGFKKYHTWNVCTS